MGSIKRTVFRGLTAAMFLAVLLFAAGCGEGEETQTTTPTPPTPVADSGCENTPNQPKRVEPRPPWGTLVTVCQSEDGTSMHIANESSSVLVVRTVGPGPPFELDSEQSDSADKLAISTALGLFPAVAGGVRVPSDEGASATATAGSISVSFEVDAAGTVAAQAAATFVELAEKQVGGLATNVVQEISQCAHDTAGLFREVAYLQDYFRKAVNASQSCTTLYGTVLAAKSVNETATPDDVIAAHAADAAKGAWIDDLGIAVDILVAHH